MELFGTCPISQRREALLHKWAKVRAPGRHQGGARDRAPPNESARASRAAPIDQAALNRAFLDGVDLAEVAITSSISVVSPRRHRRGRSQRFRRRAGVAVSSSQALTGNVAPGRGGSSPTSARTESPTSPARDAATLCPVAGGTGGERRPHGVSSARALDSGGEFHLAADQALKLGLLFGARLAETGRSSNATSPSSG